MTMIFKIAVVLALLSAVAHSKSTLNVKCGNPRSGTPATITYTGDAVAIIGYGAAGGPCKFKEDISTASFKLVVSYSVKDPCRFKKAAPSREIYGMKVESRLLHELFESVDDERFLVECSFMSYKNNIALRVDLKEKYKAAKSILIPKGIISKNVFTLSLMTVAKTKITSAVLEHSLITLNTKMVAAKKVGYLPLECMAESFDGKVKILVLATGCGTGYPWKKTEGFTMKGANGVSPAFRMFRISKRQGVVFRCSFVVCSGMCDGNSCHPIKKGRKRRSAEQGLQYDSMGLLSDANKYIERANVHVGLADEKVSPYMLVKASLYTTIFAVSGVVLVATAIVTAYAMSRLRRQRAAMTPS